MTALAVALGGAVGALARYAVSGWVQRLAGGSFPWGTFTVNVSGSFALGFLIVWLQTSLTSPGLRALLTVGVLGSFTTFSTFSLETMALLQDGEWSRAGLYAVGSLVLGVAAVVLGGAVAGVLLPSAGASS